MEICGYGFSGFRFVLGHVTLTVSVTLTDRGHSTHTTQGGANHRNQQPSPSQINVSHQKTAEKPAALPSPPP